MNITRYPREFGDYRYSLKVEFPSQDPRHNQVNLVVIMFNPATTDPKLDLKAEGHHTRQRLIKLAKEGGYRAMTEINLFAYRAPKKKELLKAVRGQCIDPVGPENDQVISEAVQDAGRVVVAWGRLPNNPLFTERARKVAELLKESGKQLFCLGKNCDGSPKNPARGGYEVQEWRP